MITIENLTFAYKIDSKLLDCLNLCINKGERIAITGENGSGKTTLLKIIAGIEPKFQGSMENSFSKTSYIPTALNNFLLPWYSISENIAFFKTNGKKLELDDMKEFDRLLTALMPCYNGNGFLSKKIYEISSGQKAVLAILCSLSNKPGLLILDEIFSNLSLTYTDIVTKYLVSTKTTIIFTSHSSRVIDCFSTSIFNVTNNKKENKI